MLGPTISVFGGSGSDSLHVYDDGANSSTAYTLTDRTVGRQLAAQITYHGMENIELVTATRSNTTRGNTVNIESTPANAAVHVRGGGGSDAFYLGTTTLDSIRGTLVVEAGAGDDAIHSPPSSENTWTIHGSNSGRLNRDIWFESMENLVGGSLSDRFLILPNCSLSGSIDAGAGDDTLDYSQRISSVIVDLANGVGTDVSGGIVGIENVTGGGGDDQIQGDHHRNLLRGGYGTDQLDGLGGADLLLGEAGNDTLRGGAGNDVLVGGVGGDNLYGGDNDDLLVAGITIYDTQDTSLRTILNEWDNPWQYAIRVRNLRDHPRVSLNRTTVQFDTAADSLYGEAGQDWFWNDPPHSQPGWGVNADMVLDAETGEHVENPTAVSPFPPPPRLF